MVGAGVSFWSTRKLVLDLVFTDIQPILWDIQHGKADKHPPVFMLRFSKPATMRRQHVRQDEAGLPSSGDPGPDG